MTAESYISLVSRWRNELTEMSARFLHDEEAAQDVVQEALTKLWLVWERLQTKEDAERMAWRLTKNECINWVRSQGVRQHVELQATEVESFHAPIDEQAEVRELRRALERVIGRLTPTRQRLWLMFAEKRMKPAEIAAVTGRSPAAIRKLLGQIREEIREVLRKGGYI